MMQRKRVLSDNPLITQKGSIKSQDRLSFLIDLNSTVLEKDTPQKAISCKAQGLQESQMKSDSGSFFKVVPKNKKALQRSASPSPIPSKKRIKCKSKGKDTILNCPTFHIILHPIVSPKLRTYFPLF